MRFLVAVGWLLVLTLPTQILAAPAEAKSAIVTGRVMSASGDFLDDVSVKIFAPSKGSEPPAALGETKTDKEGRYTIRVAVPAESLLARIRFEKTGHISTRSRKPAEEELQSEILLTPGQTTPVCHAFRNPLKLYFNPKALPVEERPKFATISGRVIDENGEPQEGVLIRAGDHFGRHITVSVEYKYSETRTDKDGRYELQVPIKSGTAKSIGVDAMKPHYRAAWAARRSDNDQFSLLMTAGMKEHASFWLTPGLYVKGIVLDPSGAPVSGASITANAGSGDSATRVRSLMTGSDGTFELFDYAPQPHQKGSTPLKAEISFWKQDFLGSTVNDIYALTPQERANLRVVLSTGNKLSGRVVDAGGTPVKNLIVEANYPDIANRRATLTDDAGRFTLQVLETGKPEIRAHSLALKQKIKLIVQIPQTKEVDLRLQQVTLQPGLKTYRLLGMTFADLSDELREYYDLGQVKFGVVVLDPGKDTSRLGIGEIVEGTHIYSVGSKSILDTRSFVGTLLSDAETDDLNAGRIGFRTRSVKPRGGMDPKIALTQSDLAELKQALPSIKSLKRKFPMLGVIVTGNQSCLVRHLVAESPADKAGLHVDDVILKVDGQPLRGAGDLVERINKNQAGKKISIEIRRGEEMLTLEATL